MPDKTQTQAPQKPQALRRSPADQSLIKTLQDQRNEARDAEAEARANLALSQGVIEALKAKVQELQGKIPPAKKNKPKTKSAARPSARARKANGRASVHA